MVENMSYFIAPDTGNRYNIFGEGGGETLAQRVWRALSGFCADGNRSARRRRQGRARGRQPADRRRPRPLSKVAEEVARQVSIEAMKPELVVLGKSQ